RCLRRVLLPGDQRDRSASVGGATLERVPLLRPGAADLAEGVLAPGALPGSLEAQGDPEEPARAAAVGGALREDQVRVERPADEGEGAHRQPVAGEDG